jgi:hypothetical protein
VFGGGARLGERGWGADAHAAEAALCVVRGVDQRPRLGLGDPPKRQERTCQEV